MLVMDADALIKLNRAGVLNAAGREFHCVVPAAVFHEAVVRGKGLHYADAEEIEQAVEAAMTALRPDGPMVLESGLAAGDLEVLALALQDEERFVVSDDRRLLTALSRRGLPFLTPPDIVNVLARRGAIGKGEAREALDRMRPLVRHVAYLYALADLEDVEEGA